jgi:polyisoprenoid-binding protein YceI
VQAARLIVMAKLLALLLLVAAPAGAEECYAVDTGSGRVGFEVRQAGVPFRGDFRRFGGELCLVGERVVRIDVWLEPASVETELPEIDAALKDREFFDVAAFPRLKFASHAVEARGEMQVARGVLEIKGRRRDVQVPFKLQGTAGRYAVSGSIELNRLDYGVGIGDWSDTRWLAARVKVEFSAPLARR